MLKKYKWFWIIGGLILIAGVAALVLLRPDATEAAAGDTMETAEAFIGDLTESATASGQITAGREATLSLATSGVVADIPVAVGDTVSAGDVLVQLETAALERAVASAEADVAIAAAELADLLAPPDAAELAAAEASVRSAQVRLDDLEDGPSAEEIAASEAGLAAAQANIWSASGSVQATFEVSESDIMEAEANLEAAQEQQEAAHNIWVLLADCEVNDAGVHTCVPSDHKRMDDVSRDVEVANAQVALTQARLDELRNPSASSVSSAQAGVASSSAQYDAALARHEALLLGASDEEIAGATADLVSAQASLTKLVAGPTDIDVTIYETRLAQAETSLQEARNALADATLLAPFAGVVTAVAVNEGEIASGTAVTLVDTGSLEVVLSVDEIDVGSLSVGQQAFLTLETWPDVEIGSEVTAIAPSAVSDSNGIVAFDVHLLLGETDLPVLIGMTANADLVTANRTDVLLVPNAAITADRDKDTYMVNVVRTDAEGNMMTVPVEVTVGLKDNRNTQITSGLVAGDEVAIGELSAPTIDFGFGPPN